MELIICPECGHTYRSKTAGYCPQCGYNIGLARNIDDLKGKRALYICLGVFSLVLAIVLILNWIDEIAILMFFLEGLWLLLIGVAYTRYSETNKMLECAEKSMNEYLVQLGKESFINIEKKRADKIKKKKKIILVVSSVLVIVIGLAMYFNSMEYKMKAVCLDYGLTNVDVTVSSKFGYEGYTFSSASITCDGFSKLDEETMFNVFTYVDYATIEHSKMVLSEDDITIESDGYVYTYSEDTSGNTNYFNILCDGVVVATKTTTDINTSDSGTFSNYTTDSDDTYGHTKYDVIVIAKNTVKERLKSPSTAEFCSVTSFSVSRTGTTWTVTGYVDAQNSFGAFCRSYFTVVITFASRDYYTIDSCNLFE